MRYRKKAVEVEAVRWEGTLGSFKEITNLYSNKDWEECVRNVDFNSPFDFNQDTISLKIHTEEGIMDAPVGNYIIKGVEGEFYSCNPSVFHKTYEPIKRVELIKYSDDMIEDLPEGIHRLPTQDGFVASISTPKGEEIINEGDFVVVFPNGVVRKIEQGSVQYSRIENMDEVSVHQVSMGVRDAESE
jgi:hypothetical protein